MGDNGELSGAEVDTSLHVNKQLAMALNTEKVQHARTTATLCRERQELMMKHHELAVLRNSMKLILENANNISSLFLNIFNEIQRVMGPAEQSNVTNENSESNNNINILKDVIVTSAEKLSPLKTLIQQEIENNGSDAEEDVHNEPNNLNSEDELDEEAQNSENCKKRRLETLAEETENEYITMRYKQHCSNQENDESFSNLSPNIVSTNETQISRSSRKLIPKRIPLSENNSLLASSPESYLLLQQNIQSKHSPLNENVSKILGSTKNRKSQRNNKKPPHITITRASKKSKKELDSFEKISEVSTYNDCNIESPQNSEIQQDDVTFNTFKKIPSSAINQTSTPYATASTSNYNGNFITRRRNKLSDEINSPSTSILKPCTVKVERMPLSSATNSINMTSQRDLVVDELDTVKKRSSRAAKAQKSYKEPSLIKKLRRE
ncbi:putative uncharacterized protein DDB_G0289963 [Onthophagus taurus]|uniref:putative uncharacterized protein DDB_G0289963 n=1 Tax=Onthophagus taurus TaxID=166361 RepID=UPI000C200016|nr:probable serine/threonine-protein kinase tsuA [Onthophagus taurus]